MDRRQFITLITMGAGTAALAGCLSQDLGLGNDDDNDTDNDTDNGDDDGEAAPEEDEEPEPEPEGGDGEPYYHYDLDVRDERENGQPLWIDQDERIYGRSGSEVLISDDWWQTTDVLASLERKVEAIVVPESGEIIVCVGGRGEEGAEVKRLTSTGADTGGETGAETLFQFDYGRVSNSLNHVAYEEIVVIASYTMSDFEGDRHGNEVILSSDGGKSFEKVLEAPLESTDATNLHIHDVEYDPYAERVWVAVGDGPNTQLYWSDDLGDSWDEIDDRGAFPMVTQVAAFKDCVTFGTDSTPEGIIRWERDDPDDEPQGIGELERPHVQIQTEHGTDELDMYARRRWHIREDLEADEDWGRELCLMPFGFSPMNDDAEESVVLASVDGDEWFKLLRTDSREILLTNVIGPLSMADEADRRLLVSDSNQGAGYQFDATVPTFWE